MKVYAIRDDEITVPKDLAYLIYYEAENRFYIELPDDADIWETPLIMTPFVRRGEKTVNAYWSKIWVEQRIIPPDRQNIGSILKDNGLNSYDEHGLLVLADGRCAQDSYYIYPVSEDLIEKKFKDRYEKKIEDVVPLQNNSLLVFFRNGKVKKCDINKIKQGDRSFLPVLNSEKVFSTVKVQIGGYGVYWSEAASIEDSTLYESGTDVPLCMADFVSFINNRVVSTSEAADILNCSRQNIVDLVERGKLHPIKTEPKNRYFLKSEVVQRKWK